MRRRNGLPAIARQAGPRAAHVVAALLVAGCATTRGGGFAGPYTVSSGAECTPSVCEVQKPAICRGAKVVSFVDPECVIVPPQAYAKCDWAEKIEDCGAGYCDPAGPRCVHPCPTSKSAPDTCAEDGLGVVEHGWVAKGTTSESCIQAARTVPCADGWCDPATATCRPPDPAAATQPQDLRISLRPWDGEWRPWVRTRVEIRSLAAGGQPAPISGSVVTGPGAFVVAFRTDARGVGTVEFVPKPGTAYRLKIEAPVAFEPDVPSTFIPDETSAERERRETEARVTAERKDEVVRQAAEREERRAEARSRRKGFSGLGVAGLVLDLSGVLTFANGFLSFRGAYVKNYSPEVTNALMIGGAIGVAVGAVATGLGFGLARKARIESEEGLPPRERRRARPDDQIIEGAER